MSELKEGNHAFIDPSFDVFRHKTTSLIGIYERFFAICPPIRFV